MQVVARLFWLGLFLLIAKAVNALARRPMMNPWLWFGASYAVMYAAGIAVGLANNNPNLAYLAGSYMPITLIAVCLGLWRAPKWRAHQAKPPSPAVDNDHA